MGVVQPEERANDLNAGSVGKNRVARDNGDGISGDDRRALLEVLLERAERVEYARGYDRRTLYVWHV